MIPNSKTAAWLDLMELREELGAKIREATDVAQAHADTKGAWRTSDEDTLDALWAQYERVDPFFRDPADDIQTAELKARGQDVTAKMDRLALLARDEGEAGMRSVMLDSYLHEREAIIKTLRSLQGQG